jgi:hypothetical protein
MQHEGAAAHPAGAPPVQRALRDGLLVVTSGVQLQHEGAQLHQHGASSLGRPCH